MPDLVRQLDEYSKTFLERLLSGTMPFSEILAVSIGFCLLLIFFAFLYAAWKRDPFRYPYYYIDLDVTGRRLPDMGVFINRYLDEHGLDEIKEHQEAVEDWKERSERKVERAVLFRHRRHRQYVRSLDDENTYVFRLIRKVRGYTQKNYRRYPYEKTIVASEEGYSFDEVAAMYKRLGSPDTQVVTRQFIREQRHLMTQELRHQIMERDNYTCRICGRYMPDGKDIQIDHIIPVSKGGRTVPGNLQVLCADCNTKKSNYILPDSVYRGGEEKGRKREKRRRQPWDR